VRSITAAAVKHATHARSLGHERETLDAVIKARNSAMAAE
jgi:hypothetical protein